MPLSGTKPPQVFPGVPLCLALALLLGCSIVHTSAYLEAGKADRRGDYSTAARLYSSVASADSYEFRQTAQFRLAEMQLEGLGVRQDPDAAISLLRRVATGPDRDWRIHAYNRLARLHETGFPQRLEPNRKEAAQYYAQAVNEGSKTSRESLNRLARYPDVFVSLHAAEFRHDNASAAPAGMAAAYDAFKAPDYARAYTVFLWHARNGNAEAQAAVAALYKDGLYVATDKQRYAAWAYLAAYNGNRRAQLELGLLYRTTDIVPVDDDEAERWLKAASDQGLPDATNALGVLALHPFDERRQSDPVKAVRYFREAAASGSTFALANLGDAHIDGTGVPKDRARAKEYYLAAAERGNIVARQRLLEHYNIAYGAAQETPSKSPDVTVAARPPGSPQTAPAQPKPDPPLTAVELYAAVSKSVIRLYALNVAKKDDAAQGSAVAVTPQIAVTNCHVLEGKNAYGSKTSQGVMLFESIGGDLSRDICLIKTDQNLAAVTATRRYGDLRVGERVYAIGSPKGLENTLSEGIISGLRTVDGIRYIQITAPITNGSSGGGLFDERGRLIGITTLGAKTGNLNFAVTVDEALSLLEKTK
jgi:TPR repeat protein